MIEKQENQESCKQYKKGEFESCLKTEIEKRFTHILNCTPPWFTQDYEQVYEIKFFLSVRTSRKG